MGMMSSILLTRHEIHKTNVSRYISITVMLVCWTLFLRRKIIFKRKKITFFNQIIQFRVFTEIFVQIEVEVYTKEMRLSIATDYSRPLVKYSTIMFSSTCTLSKTVH